ncbi:hypothetical protein [Streptomyces sp. NPDC001268]|uniref:hypothetical protein n=1 Tax=Streptomyces sp. NPDC001268 TaxID=3364553 RepID=UPI003687946B
MILLHPVLEVRAARGFALWPVADVGVGPYDFLPLSGALQPAEVGTAVLAIAEYNDVGADDDGPPRPADPVGSVLHGLLTQDPLAAAGGLRVIDTDSAPPCCRAAATGWRSGGTGSRSSTATAGPPSGTTPARAPNASVTPSG